MNPQRIDTSNAQKLRFWAEKLGTSPREIEDAVGAVGSDPAAVKAYLARLRQPIRSARTAYEVSRTCLVFQLPTRMTTGMGQQVSDVEAFLKRKAKRAQRPTPQ